MPGELDRYFAAERAGGALLLACALAGAGLSAGMLAQGSPYRPMSWPLLAVGLAQLALGATLVLRTPRQVRRLSERLRSAPAGYRAEESARMRRVQSRFTLYKRIEIGLLAAGLALASVEGYGQTLYAVGLGLVLEAGLMLAFDLTAERRGRRYLDAVDALPDA
jgi:hypothetical protein